MAVRSIPMSPEKAAEFGNLVRDLRAPIAQAAIAEGRDFSAEWLSKLESGRTLNVSVTKLAALSEALDLPKGALAQWITDGAALPERLGADPDALRNGHGGSEGWPPWLEEKFVRLENRVERLEEVADRWEALLPPDDSPPDRGGR